ncbi:hypothetical protein CDAR_485131 [Caerostris darwini]|uniref:Uncharacterized protein n=1 Tax=Caerostris darwini TaxID=1538125 RepID=A0AAV4PAU4_9ARAC|nr:hypothetical protein CDAR_485131 [Caerostris darwini]
MSAAEGSRQPPFISSYKTIYIDGTFFYFLKKLLLDFLSSQVPIVSLIGKGIMLGIIGVGIDFGRPLHLNFIPFVPKPARNNEMLVPIQMGMIIYHDSDDSDFAGNT